MPVCAWKNASVTCIADKYPCAVNAGNACEACSHPDVVSYSTGECPSSHLQKKIFENPEYCSQENVNQICTKEYNPQCAYFDVTVDCGKDRMFCAVNAGNPCTACSIAAVSFFVPGACPEEDLLKKEEEKTNVQVKQVKATQLSTQRIFENAEYCPQEKVNQICTREYNPQCAYFDVTVDCGKDRLFCGFNAGNPCTACAIENVSFFIPGACPEGDLYKKEQEKTNSLKMLISQNSKFAKLQ